MLHELPADLPPGKLVADVLLADETAIIRVAGEIDLATIDVFLSVVDEAMGSGSDVIVDLCGCSFIDVGGLRAVVQNKDEASARDTGFVVACLTGGGPARVLCHLLGERPDWVQTSRHAALEHLSASGSPRRALRLVPPSAVDDLAAESEAQRAATDASTGAAGAGGGGALTGPPPALPAERVPARHP